MIRFSKSTVKKRSDIAYGDNQIIQNTFNQMRDKLSSNHNFDALYTERKIVKLVDEFDMEMKQNRFGLYTFKVYIQGRKYQFLIDTGAQISGILASTMHKISVTKVDSNTHIGSIGGGVKEANLVEVEKLFIGAIQVSRQPFVVLEDKDFRIPFTKVSLVRFDGIIGWDILSQLDFELDDREKCFRIIKPTINFSYQNLIPTTFPVLIAINQDRKGMVFGFDSGAHESWLGNDYVEYAKLKVVGKRRMFGMGILGMEKLISDIIKKDKLNIHQHQVELYNVRTGRVDMFEHEKLAGVFGNCIIQGRKIQILNSKQFIRIV